MRFLRRASSRLALCVASMALVGTLAFAFSGNGFFTPDFRLTITSLNPKTVPVRIEDDGNLKDVVVKDRTSYKPGKGLGTGLEKRLRFKSKVDGGASLMALAMETTGDISARILLAADSVVGLVDGASLGFFERRSEGHPTLRIEAVWNAGIDGLTLRALADGVPLDSDLDAPMAHEATLLFSDTGNAIVPQVIVADVTHVLGNHDQTGEGSDTATWALGVQDLGPKGTLWFTNLRFEWPYGAVDTGPVETIVLTQAFAAWSDLQYAADLVSLPPPHDMNLLNNLLFSIGSSLGAGGGTYGIVQNAVDNGTLLPSNDADATLKAAKDAAGWAIPTSNDLQALIMKGATSAASLKKHIATTIDKAELLMGLLNGFKSTSHGKLEQAAVLEVY